MNASWIVRHGTSLHPQLSIDVAYLFESEVDGPEYTVYDELSVTSLEEGGWRKW